MALMPERRGALRQRDDEADGFVVKDGMGIDGMKQVLD